MDLVGKRVAIVGLGASGIAAARLCLARGARVVGVDVKPLAELDDARALGIDVHAQGEPLSGCDLVVVSPGVPTFPALDAFAGPVWGEVELAFQCRSHASPIVAVGGTNGKSTVTTLIAELLDSAGKSVFAGGNLGEPWAAHVDEPHDVVVLEVSSFQMERVEAFRPAVGVLLNITEDHLDRYASFDEYARAKGNCFVRQEPEDLAVIPVDDALCLREVRRGRARVVTFGPGGDVTAEGYEVRLRGAHNTRNVAAALAAVTPFVDPRSDAVRSVLARFEGLGHRMVPVGEVDGVRFYDDSKGTNVGAAATAVLGVEEPRVVLIAGGRDKLGSYEPLVRALAQKGRAAVLIGEAALRLEEALGPHVKTVRASSMADAVAHARRLAQPGDAVLLSPACSSFDMFRDYKHRGDEFVRAVRALGGP